MVDQESEIARRAIDSMNEQHGRAPGNGRIDKEDAAASISRKLTWRPHALPDVSR
jgi:hypothetical protein